MHELLAPAGTFEAMEAAIAAGADAVYLGTSRHNARLHGENFTEDTLLDAVRYCHIRHKKVYLTLNTLLTDKELQAMPDYAAFLAESGVDAVIVQDAGLASLLKKAVPALPLHASTQMTIHNRYGLQHAKKMGFERAVLSREAFSKELIENSPLEIEMFIHGALCVSYSGQCYFSSMLARRSGNRGTCAQPCRHKYKNGYDLSLHDLCLAGHIPEILSLPIASLKIEGRLKSPAYVGGVVSVYRKLLDEKRSATKEEMAFLEGLFSRQGFTDGYFVGKKGKSMFGYRTEADKEASRLAAVPPIAEKKVPLFMEFTAEAGTPAILSVSDGVYSATAEGAVPEKAAARPLTAESCIKSLAKLGGTPYEGEITARVAPDLFLSAAAINSMRREALSLLEEQSIHCRDYISPDLSCPNVPASKIQTHCVFQTPSQVPTKIDMDFMWFPLFSLTTLPAENAGVILPTILFDEELPPVKEHLLKLKKEGLVHVMCNTHGQSLLCRELGFTPHGGPGLHIYNGISAKESDMETLSASPELLASSLLHMPKPLPLTVTVYGRQTLMTMENCLAKAHASCHNYKAFYPLTDEKGNVFPVLCAYPHRNEVLNARPLYMLDKLSILRGANISAFVLRFTTETKEEVSRILKLYKNEEPAPFPFTRGCFFAKEQTERPKN